MGRPASEKKPTPMKEVLKKEAEKGTKIRFKDRMKLEIVTATKYYKVGQIIEPSPIVGKALISDGIAKEVK